MWNDADKARGLDGFDMTDKEIAEDFIREMNRMSFTDRLIALHGGAEIVCIVCDGDNWTIIDEEVPQ